MAIGTDATVEFFGSQSDLASSSASVSTDLFSVTSDLTDFTNSDDAPLAAVLGEFTFATAPDAGSSVNLYLRLMNTEGTNDQEVPSANFLYVAVGSFPVKNITTIQQISIVIPLPNVKISQIYEFYIQNKTGQTISAGWTIFVTPKTIGPKA